VYRLGQQPVSEAGDYRDSCLPSTHDSRQGHHFGVHGAQPLEQDSIFLAGAPLEAVSVAPGQRHVAVTPDPFNPFARASKNEITQAFVA
jgi:hypothetical protein